MEIKGKTMKIEYGILVDHDYGVQVHRKDCKDFLNPKNHTSTIGDFTVKEQIRIPLELDQETNFDQSEDLKKLVVTLSDSMWGAESILYDPIIYKCTDLVNRKTRTNLNYGFIGQRYSYDNENDQVIFRSLINHDWLETTYNKEYNYTSTHLKSEYYRGLYR